MIFFLAILLFLSTSCSKESHQVGDLIVQNEGIAAKYLDLTNEQIYSFLTNTDWGPDYGMAGIIIKFNQDGSIAARTNFEGGYRLEAKYKVENGKIIMTVAYEEERYNPPLEITYTIREDNRSFKYSRCLVSVSGSNYERVFWDLSTIKKLPESIEVDENRVIIEKKVASITEYTQFYIDPKREQLKYDIYDPEKGNIGTRPLGSILDVVENIEVIGYYEKNPEWLLVLKPIAYGSYYEMKCDEEKRIINYCWVRVSEISF